MDPPEGLVDRVFEASVEDLPTRVLRFETPQRRVRPPLVGYAALLLVALLSWLAVLDGESPTESRERVADAASFADVPLEAPRQSEVLLVAVTDPDIDEDWFLEEAYGSGVQTEVEAVLRSRMFGVDDLAGDVLAMLGGPTS